MNFDPNSLDLNSEDPAAPPPRMTPEAGIAAMTERREAILKEMRATNKAATQCENPESWTGELTRLRHQLEDTDRRLAEYQAQLGGRN